MVDICNDWQEATARANVTLDMATYLAAHDQINGSLLTDMETGKTTIDEFSTLVGQLVNIPSSDIKASFRKWLKDPMPGMIELAGSLKTKGFKTACLSNTSHMHWDMMHDSTSEHYLALDHILDHCFASHLVGIMKPAPGIYEHVEQATGHLPSQILFFDDNHDNIAAANDRGWNAVLITQDKPVLEQVEKALASL